MPELKTRAISFKTITQKKNTTEGRDQCLHFTSKMFLEHRSNVHDSQEPRCFHLNIMHYSKHPVAKKAQQCDYGGENTEELPNFKIYHKQILCTAKHKCMYNIKKKSQTMCFLLPFWISVYSNNWFKSV